jgi:hypothetical protein
MVISIHQVPVLCLCPSFSLLQVQNIDTLVLSRTSRCSTWQNPSLGWREYARDSCHLSGFFFHEFCMELVIRCPILPACCCVESSQHWFMLLLGQETDCIYIDTQSSYGQQWADWTSPKFVRTPVVHPVHLCVNKHTKKKVMLLKKQKKK